MLLSAKVEFIRNNFFFNYITIKGAQVIRKILLLVCFINYAGCDAWSWLKSSFSDTAPVASDAGQTNYKVETIAKGFKAPWAIEFVDSNIILVTEKPGRLRIIRNGILQPEPIQGTPAVHEEGQGGLLDIKLHPEFSKNKYIYLAYTVKEEDMMTRIARYTFTEGRLTNEKIIFRGVKGSGRPQHFGTRMQFGKDGKLYFTLGERHEGERAQDLMDLNGSTIRLNEDGSIPEDNPFVNREDVRPEIFSFGHRNPQGLDIHPENGMIFNTEHGPTWSDGPGGGDEINIIEAGKNYGWPAIHHRQEREGMVTPIIEYTPAIAPSGASFYAGDAFPEWKNNLFVAALVGKAVIRLVVEGRKVTGQEFLVQGKYGRIRDVEVGPDGFLYFLTSETDQYGDGNKEGDMLMRIVPDQKK